MKRTLLVILFTFMVACPEVHARDSFLHMQNDGKLYAEPSETSQVVGAFKKNDLFIWKGSGVQLWVKVYPPETVFPADPANQPQPLGFTTEGQNLTENTYESAKKYVDTIKHNEMLRERMVEKRKKEGERKEPDGFLGYLWGSTVEECPDLNSDRRANVQESVYYPLAENIIHLGEIALYNPTLAFHNNIMWNGFASLKSKDSFQKLIEFLSAKYGSPTETKPMLNYKKDEIGVQNTWDIGNVRIFAQYNYLKNNGSIHYVNTKLAVAPMNESLEKAKKEFRNAKDKL